ncbi:pyrimidine-nucleoside phosphorylase [Gracilibacillus halotolerans]|uniref:Pyrimidine-nucleoside phosphorylase n=1 Tax=Gracilibacillus halotolerans TaxID=74386 RepID=A0A841RL69_9BACI|nr:pyrimidine-nucleoside phosphorylase [Gracilibacillus halotolerans]MBB6511714.1 pyrimidine-nucleoside phosphorylase [Gracilibacillus halotolerans]
MRMVDIISRKRNGESLSIDEIEFFINGYMEDEIPDYQVSALMMAIYYKGMSEEETAHLTNSMVQSGEIIDLSSIEGHKVDKHSTGGVGDKTTFIVGPLAAAAGLPVAKMSGRGLGHTGGTIDKLEAIPGLQVEISNEDFMKQVNDIKLSVVGQTGDLAPADKKLYALRDVTATVDSIPLIASSVMSKKIASGADSIVLDVKTGSGAFMKTIEDARELAKRMVEIGNKLGRNTTAVISNMDQPLGFEIGNANEIKEAVQVLQGEKIADLRELSIELVSHMTILANVYSDVETAKKELAKLLDNGQAFEVFKQFIKAQHGDTSVIDDLTKLPSAEFQLEVEAPKEGYVSEIEAEKIGLAAMHLGAGRQTKDDSIDHAAGITLQKKIGDYVKKGEVIVELHSNSNNMESSKKLCLEAITISETKPEKSPMIYEIITE